MSNYRVRQVLALCKRLPHTEAEKDLLVGLATWLDDDSTEVRLSTRVLAETASLHPDTVKHAKQQLRKKGWLEYDPATRPGELTLYRVPVLEGVTGTTPPSANPQGGVGAIPPKGGSESGARGGREAPEGGVGEIADQPERDHKLNLLAKPVAKSSSGRAFEAIRAAAPDATDDEIETYAREIEDKWKPENLARYIRSFPALKVAEGIAAIRMRGSPAATPADARPCAVPFPDICPRCSSLHHDPLPCRDAEPSQARQRTAASPPLLAAVSSADDRARCQDPKCRTPAEIIDGDGHHKTCRYLADIRARGAPPPVQAREHPAAS